MSKNFQGKTCVRFLRIMKQAEHPAIAVLYKTFGDETTCLERFWEMTRNNNRRHVTEIHFSNEAGRRMNFLDKNDFMVEYDVDAYNLLLEEMPPWFERKIRERVKDILAMTLQGRENGNFILSEGLEDNYTLLAWQNLHAIIKEEWPFAIARNPALRHIFLEQDFQQPDDLFLERHGYKRKLDQANCLASGDGQDVDFLEGSGKHFAHAKAASFKQVKGWIARGVENGCITFIWAAKWQGFFESHKRPPLPLSRTFQFDFADKRQVQRLLNHSKKVEKRMLERGIEPRTQPFKTAPTLDVSPSDS